MAATEHLATTRLLERSGRGALSAPSHSAQATEIIRQAEPDPARRPGLHVGG